MSGIQLGIFAHFGLDIRDTTEGREVHCGLSWGRHKEFRMPAMDRPAMVAAFNDFLDGALAHIAETDSRLETREEPPPAMTRSPLEELAEVEREMRQTIMGEPRGSYDKAIDEALDTWATRLAAARRAVSEALRSQCIHRWSFQEPTRCLDCGVLLSDEGERLRQRADTHGGAGPTEER